MFFGRRLIRRADNFWVTIQFQGVLGRRMLTIVIRHPLPYAALPVVRLAQWKRTSFTQICSTCGDSFAAGS